MCTVTSCCSKFQNNDILRLVTKEIMSLYYKNGEYMPNYVLPNVNSDDQPVALLCTPTRNTKPKH